MSISAALRDRWKQAGVASGNVFRDQRPQGRPLPAVVLLVVSDPRPSTYEGRQVARESRVQADCMAASRGDADALAEAVISASEGRVAVGGVQFAGAFVASTRTYSERLEDGVTTFVTSLDLMVWHQPAA